MPSRNPSWFKDELILALDLYFQFGPGKLSKVSPDVLALSNTLNKLPLETERPDAPRFRNPNGVYMKLCNFLRFDPDYRGAGLTHGGKQEEAIWEEFVSGRSFCRCFGRWASFRMCKCSRKPAGDTGWC